MHHAFFYISLPSLHDYYVKVPNFTFCRGREQKNDFLFLFLFDTVFYNSTPEKFGSIWRIQRVGISAIKFEVARIHFLSGVFIAVAVAVVVACGCKRGMHTRNSGWLSITTGTLNWPFIVIKHNSLIVNSDSLLFTVWRSSQDGISHQEFSR